MNDALVVIAILYMMLLTLGCNATVMLSRSSRSSRPSPPLPSQHSLTIQSTWIHLILCFVNVFFSSTDLYLVSLSMLILGSRSDIGSPQITRFIESVVSLFFCPRWRLAAWPRVWRKSHSAEHEMYENRVESFVYVRAPVRPPIADVVTTIAW